MELILHMAAINVELQADYDAVKQSFSGFDFIEDSFEESGLSRQDLMFPTLGFQIGFDHRKLLDFRLHIRKSGFSRFKEKW